MAYSPVNNPMASSSVEAWDINGVSLHKYGWSVRTIGGARYSVPPMRGANQVYAFVPGQDFRSKQPDSRTITLTMWMMGVNPDTGTSAACYPMEVQWNENWQFLRKLFWTPRNEINLTRRWQRVDADGQIYIQTATAKAQLASDLQPTMNGGRIHSEFQVDLLLADPFFYGDEVEVSADIGETITFFNPGDYDTFHKNLTIEFHDNLSHVYLSNTATNPDVRLYYNNLIHFNETVTFDVPHYTATSNVLDPDYGYNMLPYVEHTGSRPWMGIVPGTNTLTMIGLYSGGASGTGGWSLRYRPAYI